MKKTAIMFGVCSVALFVGSVASADVEEACMERLEAALDDASESCACLADALDEETAAEYEALPPISEGSPPDVSEALQEAAGACFEMTG